MILKLPEKQQETVMNSLQIAAPNVDQEHYTLRLFPKLSFYGTNTCLR